MKNLKILILLVLTTCITFSCKKDDDASAPPAQTAEEIAALFIGTWRYTSSTLNGADDALTECEQMSTITFVNATEATAVDTYSDTGSAPCMEENLSATYSINNDEITTTVMINGNEESNTVKFTINSTTLVIVDMDGTDEYRDTYTRQ